MAKYVYGLTDMTDLTSPFESEPRRRAQKPTVCLETQVESLRTEVAVLRKCLRESLDLQRGIIDDYGQNMYTTTSNPLPACNIPMASSTPYAQAQAVHVPKLSGTAFDCSVAPDKAANFSQTSLLLNSTTRALASVLNQSKLEPPVFRGDGKIQPEEWLQLVDVYRTSLGLNDAQILLELPRFLAKEPRKWFSVLSEHITAWAQFRTLFKSVFLPSDNQERILRGILDRVQAPDEPFPTFVAHLLSEFKKLKSPPTEQDQIELICKHALERYRVAIYGTQITSVVDLLMRAHELHSVLGPNSRNGPPLPMKEQAREIYCFKCSEPGFTSRNCPNCNFAAQANVFPGVEKQNFQTGFGTPGRSQSSENRSDNRGEQENKFGQQKGNFKGGRTFYRGNPPSRR